MKTPTNKGTNYDLHLGDNLETLKTYPNDYFDSIVQDPPYGIEFLGKEWDKHTGTLELYKECLRVLKPGGYMLAFSAARTYHQLASNIELAGFEIRDQLMWLYASGFPKAQDIGKAIDKRAGIKHDYVDYHTDQEDTRVVSNTANAKNRHCKDCGKPLGVSIIKCDKGNDCLVNNPPIQSEWAGFKTALKPAHEPIVMARKPFRGSTIDNVLKNGLGAMNIDATRVPWADADPLQEWNEKYQGCDWRDGGPVFQGTDHEEKKKKKSDREEYQKNCELLGGYTKMYDKEGGPEIFNTLNTTRKKSDRPKPQLNPTMVSAIGGGDENITSETMYEPADGRYPSNVIGEVAEGYQKYFYCPKVSRKERHVGFTELPPTDPSGKFDRTEEQTLNANERIQTKIGNNHPTVKPVALMDYLIKLVTPPSIPTLQRKVLDPFMGSGSTGMAATALGHHFTGCELDPKYVAIAEKRIEAWSKPEVADEPNNNFNELFD